jgi:micrococcal nuclease
LDGLEDDDSERSFIVAQVTRAVDGDSLDAHVDGNRTLVGYLGVDAPAPNEPCGPEALARNRDLAGVTVQLEEDPSHRFDDAGRRLYYAYSADGRSIDEVLVREGLARATRFHARYGAYLAQIQADAEANQRGCLWAGTR